MRTSHDGLTEKHNVVASQGSLDVANLYGFVSDITIRNAPDQLRQFVFHTCLSKHSQI